MLMTPEIRNEFYDSNAAMEIYNAKIAAYKAQGLQCSKAEWIEGFDVLNRSLLSVNIVLECHSTWLEENAERLISEKKEIV